MHSVILTTGITKSRDKVDLQLSYDTIAPAHYTNTSPARSPIGTLPEETVIITTLPPPDALPLVKSDLGRGTLDLMYALTPHIGVGVSWWYERYQCEDYTLDAEANPELARGQTVLLGYMYTPLHGEQRLGPNGLSLVDGVSHATPPHSTRESPGFGDWCGTRSCERLCLSDSCHPPPVWVSGEIRYADIVIFVMLPALFAAGLLLMPAGLWLQNRRPGAAPAGAEAWPTIDLNVRHTRRAILFFMTSTLVGLVALSFASQRAVEYSESQQFCGQACHQVMGPHYTAHQNGLHGRVNCVECHVEPGAQGFFKAKLHGTNQLRLAITNRFSRPVLSPLDVGRPNVYTSCEQCHFPDRFIGDVVKVVYEFADNEANSKTMSTLRLHVGGPVAGTGRGAGIHWHMNRSNVVEYVATDEKLEQIPYVRVSRQTARCANISPKVPTPPIYRAGPPGAWGASIATTVQRTRSDRRRNGLSTRRWGRSSSARGFRSSGARPFGRCAPNIQIRSAALRGIERSIRGAIDSSKADEAALRQAVAVSQSIYRTNIFPSMKITWGTYPDRVGHTTSQGCFRCHDDSHATKEGRALGQDCEQCHSNRVTAA